MAVVALTLPFSRRSPVRVPRRDLVAGSIGGLVLRVSLVTADRPGGVPFELGTVDARMWLAVWPEPRRFVSGDYGFGRMGPPPAVTQPVGATALNPRWIDLPVPPFAGGAAWWSLRADLSGQDFELCQGALRAGLPSEAGWAA